LIVQESALSRKKKPKKYTDRPDGRFPWLELAIDFNANGNRASSANDPMRLCEQCSATTEMQRVSLDKECLFAWKALADVPDAKIRSLDLFCGANFLFGSQRRAGSFKIAP